MLKIPEMAPASAKGFREYKPLLGYQLPESGSKTFLKKYCPNPAPGHFSGMGEGGEFGFLIFYN